MHLLFEDVVSDSSEARRRPWHPVAFGVWVCAMRPTVAPRRDGVGVSGRSGPSHGMSMPRHTRTSLPAARLALVEIGMRWRGGVMPNLSSCELRHLLENSCPFARPLRRRRRFDGKEHKVAIERTHASDVRSSRGALGCGVASHRNQPADGSHGKPSCTTIRHGMLRGGPWGTGIGRVEVI